MENKKSHFDVARMSLSQLERLLRKYKVELEVLNPSEERREWLVAMVQEIEDEIKRRSPSSGDGEEGDGEEVEGAGRRSGIHWNWNKSAQIGSVLGVLILAAVRFQIAREILTGLLILSMIFGAISIGVGLVKAKFWPGESRRRSFINASVITFAVCLVFWFISALVMIPDYNAGNAYWDTSCLCFRLTEKGIQARKEAAEREAQRGCRTVQQSPWDGSVSPVLDWFEENLLDPGSLQVIRWGRLTELEYGCVVVVRFRAKNAFGGYVIGQKAFYISPEGYIWDVRDQ
jgi:hypothetical protein